MKTKKVSILISLLFFFAIGHSQIQKGTIVLSGKTDLNFLFSNTEISRDSIATNKMRSNQFGFYLGAGYFVADNLSVALSGAYSYSYSKTEPFNFDPGKATITTTLGVIPQIIYYFPLEGKLKPFLSIGAGYLWLRERDSRISNNNNIVYSLTGPSFNGAAGLSYFITQSVAFDLGLQYTHNRLKDKLKINEIQKQNIVAGSFGVTIFFLK